MKLFYMAPSSALGIHVLMEEIGKPYETQAVNLREDEHFRPAFTAINPKSKVPVLVRDDGTVLTEFPAIAYWLARINPEKKLLPDEIEDQTRIFEVMDYVVATVHMQGLSRLFRPRNHSPNPADETAVRARGREIIENGFALLDRRFAGGQYVVGGYSIADCALFYVEFLADRFGITLPPNLVAHFENLLARPAVQRALAAEGLA